MDANKEQQLLKMAKEHYESYADVGKFAEVLDLKPGVVYLTLKHHSFIKQNETTQYRVLDAYYQHNGNLRAITETVGLSVWVVAKTLEQLGLSPDWSRYKAQAENSIKGDVAEAEFRRLVPSAIDMNRTYMRNNPVFDFVVNEKTVDVKLSTLTKSGRGSWQQYNFRARRTPEDTELPDFFCVFCAIDKDKPFQEGNYYVLLIPKEVIPDNNMRVAITKKGGTANSAMYWDFEVPPTALASILGDI